MLFSVISAGIFFVVKPTYAITAAGVLDSAGDAVAWLINKLLQAITGWLGQLFLSLTEQLVKVCQYNNFLNSQAVQTGWVIVRDIANMFFVVILLVIAIATILRVESYNYKKLLPKFLLMAVLINFSKTICGIVIDFSQVIMLTFVNAFKAAAGANFVQAFGIDQVYALAGGEGLDSSLSLLPALLLGLVVLLIAISTVGVLLVMLIARIIVLWILIILSPLAFLMASFPQGQSAAKKWQDNFSKYVITGPMLAFFIWLALIVAGGGTGNEQVGVTVGTSTVSGPAVGVGALGTMEKLSSVIVATAMFLIGLMIAKDMGVAGSGLADSVLSNVRKAGTAPLNWAKSGAKWGAKTGFNKMADITYARTGVALPGSAMRAKISEDRRKSLQSQREARGMGKVAERLAQGRYTLAALGDPRVMTKMSLYERGRLMLGKQDAKDKMQRIADSYAGKAAGKMYAEDPYQAEVLKQRTTAAMGEARASDDMGERKSLEGAVRSKQNELRGVDQELSSIDTARRRQGLSDVDLKNDIAKERAEEQVAKEERKRPMTDQERVDRTNELIQQNKGEIDVDKERKRIDSLMKKEKQADGSMVSRAEKREGELIMRRGTLEDSVKVDASNLEKVKLRLDDPAKAKTDATKRRTDAITKNDKLSKEKNRNQSELRRLADMEKVGPLTPAERDRRFDLETRQKEIDIDINNNQSVVNNLDVELKKIEKASGLKSAEDANSFFKLPYEEQLKKAKEGAKAASETEFFKKLLAAQADGKIDEDEMKDLVELVAKKNLALANQNLAKKTE